MMDSNYLEIIDSAGLQRTIRRLAHEIVERRHGIENVVIIGIRSRGVPIAKRLNENIAEIEGGALPMGVLDVTMHRDDVLKKVTHPQMGTTEIDFDIDGKIVILVDDVLYTGRTVRAALDAIIAFGRPRAIQLAVLIDRGHRQLPIRADYIGKTIPTAFVEKVKVRVREIDDKDGVFLVKPKKES